jgi:death-on-curing family protein
MKNKIVKILRTNKDLPKGEIVIYRAKDGSAKLEAKLEEDTIWLRQEQIALLFGTKRPAITKHLRNIFKSGELDRNSVSSILEHTAADGKIYKTQFYNLDMIISIGYRVNSKRATEFRIWATQVLRKYIVNGVAINSKRLQDKEVNLSELENAINLLRSTMENKALTGGEAKGLLKVITEYANSWLLLNKYDEGKIKIEKGKTRGIEVLDYRFVKDSIEKFKSDLIKKKTASDLFGRENSNRLEAILNSISQSFGGKALYSSLEEKAAHLLYFIIKDHPFVDGNKRIGSLLFILFLQHNKFLLNKKGEKKINDNALVALALLVAQSKPGDKNIMIALITNLIKK